MARKTYQKEFTVPLGLDSQIRFRFDLNQGGIEDFVVQYEVEIAGRLHPVVRYDCAHGYPHRDTLGAGGRVIAKERFPPGISRKDAMELARRDLRAHWETYREEFLRRVADERTSAAADVRAGRSVRKRRAARRRR